MKLHSLKFKVYGESAILIEWPKEINDVILFDVCNYSEKIRGSNIDAIIDINHVYSSLLVNYNPERRSGSELITELKGIYKEREIEYSFKSKTIQVPVCYDSVFSIDLLPILEAKQMDREEFIMMHSSIRYTIYGIGFLPGFLYLGGLPKKLSFPRKVTPNLNVLKGSVAIGGEQTGIYPQDSPGGWHIIGKTPINLFNSKKEPPTFLRTGDKIKFESISKKDFNKIEALVNSNDYSLKEIYND